MSLLAWFRGLDEKLDGHLNLSKRFPGYFEKWVFRGMMVVILGIVLAAGQSNGWEWGGSYVECTGNNVCAFYVGCLPVCTDGNPVCEETCKPIMLAPGTVIGEKPTWLISNGVNLILLVVVLAFVVNHLVYEVRRRW